MLMFQNCNCEVIVNKFD